MIRKPTNLIINTLIYTVRNFKKSLPSLSFFSHKAEAVISIRQLDNILADPDVHTLADVLEKVETRKNSL